MDPIALIVAAGAYVAAEVAKKCADLTIETAFKRVVSLFKAKLGRNPRPDDYDLSVVRGARLELDPALNEQVHQILARSSPLRRARLVASVLQGARVLWVDDIPANNVYERHVLNALGIRVECAETTEEALRKVEQTGYDLILSDMARHHQPDAGLQLLRELRRSGRLPPVVFYSGHLDGSRGTPRERSGSQTGLNLSSTMCWMYWNVSAHQARGP